MALETERDRFVRLVFYGVVLLVGYLVFRVVRPFLQALGWAGVFAVTLFPLHARLARRIGANRAALATVLLAVVLLVGPALGLLSMLAGELSQLTDRLQDWQPSADTPARLRGLWDRVRELSPLALPADPAVLVVEAVKRATAFLAPRASAALKDVAQFFFGLTVMLFALFFLLRDGARFMQVIRDLLPFEEARRDRLIAQTGDLIVASVGAGLAVAATQGVISAIAFALLGFAAPVFWGVVAAFFSLLPVLGAAIVWLPAAAWLFATGETVRGLILLAVGAGVISMADNVLRPLLLSARPAANGLVMFIGLLGGVAAFGFIGLVLGPIVLVAAGILLEALTGPEKRPARS